MSLFLYVIAATYCYMVLFPLYCSAEAGLALCSICHFPQSEWQGREV